MADELALAVLELNGSFTFHAHPEKITLSCGDYVLLTTADDRRFLGQVEEARVEYVEVASTDRSGDIQVPFAEFGSKDQTLWIRETTTVVPRAYNKGGGRVLAPVRMDQSPVVAEPRSELADCVGEARIERASDELVECYWQRAYLRKQLALPVGTLLGVSKPVPAKLIASGLSRPTGLFGQSGSGKSFALGIILEELHLRSKNEIRIVVLDPNGDFVGLREDLRELEDIQADRGNRHQLDTDEYQQYSMTHQQKRDLVKVLSNDGSVKGAEGIVVRLGDIDVRELAAALRMDPTTDRAEYAALVNADQSLREHLGRVPELGDLAAQLARQGPGDSGALGLLIRMKTLGFFGLAIWAGGTLVTDALADSGVHTLVVDVSKLSRVERGIVSAVVFRRLWDLQSERRAEGDLVPTVLVVDEAHNVFPARTLYPGQHVTVDWGSRIAGEGRKLGLYLLVASQLPSKIHEHVLTQCGNLILMKMLSQSDIDALKDSASFVSEMMLDQSKFFGVGDALIMGGIVPSPCLVHFEGRKTREGGSDMEVPWAEEPGLSFAPTPDASPESP